MAGAAVRILLSCPKCGAPFTIDDESRSVVCEHCASRLLLEAPNRQELYIAEGRVKSGPELLEILIRYRLSAHRAEIVSRYQDSDGNPPSELWIANRLRAYEAKLRDRARLLEAERIQVPYWHITGTIVHGILGRVRSTKATRVRAFAVEHTVPAYDETQANLRDRGLRLDQMLVRPLTAAVLESAGHLLPRVPFEERKFQDIDRWLQRDLDPDIERMAKHALFLPARRLLVYRPYWVARLLTDTGEEWILFDSGFETIAGYPSAAEAAELRQLEDKDPLGHGEESFRQVHVVASRCPDCGFEESYDPRDVLTICSNCHLGLELTSKGVRIAPYEHAARGTDVPLDGVFLPFWRYRLAIELPGGKSRLESLEDYSKALFPQPPPGFALRGQHLFVPAFRLLGTEPGDSTFKALCEWIHQDAPEQRTGKLPVGGRPRLQGVSVPEHEARALAPFVLVALHSKASAARLSALTLRTGICDARLTLEPPTLVMVPFDAQGEDAAIPEHKVRVPAMLLRGGLEVEQMRSTVLAAAANQK
jgi:DNA-directed RNA polymerase subunit RPC12/RpoP